MEGLQRNSMGYFTSIRRWSCTCCRLQRHRTFRVDRRGADSTRRRQPVIDYLCFCAAGSFPNRNYFKHSDSNYDSSSCCGTFRSAGCTPVRFNGSMCACSKLCFHASGGNSAKRNHIWYGKLTILEMVKMASGLTSSPSSLLRWPSCTCFLLCGALTCPRYQRISNNPDLKKTPCGVSSFFIGRK